MKSTNDKVSILGFGCMRFPKNDEGNIKEKESEKMLEYAIRNGVNYLDTAWPYHGEESEPFVGKFLEKKGLRKDIFLATKLPSWKIEKYEDFDHYLEKQLKKLKTEYIDYYLMHALSKKRWEKLKENNVFKFLDKLKGSDKVRAVGFSFHDDYEVFEDIIDSYDWDFCQIQYNYMDIDYQAGRKGLKLASKKNIDVVVMEPLRGGMLTGKVPEDVEKIYQKSNNNYSAAEWALRWVWNHREVNIALSGMSSMEHVRENIKIADDAESNSFSKNENEIIAEVRQKYNERTQVNCTSCEYCMPCPNDVKIPACFRLYNNAYIYNEIENMKGFYNRALDDKNKASQCIECGECLDKCPQNIDIIEELKNVKELFEEEVEK